MSRVRIRHVNRPAPAPDPPTAEQNPSPPSSTEPRRAPFRLSTEPRSTPAPNGADPRRARSPANAEPRRAPFRLSTEPRHASPANGAEPSSAPSTADAESRRDPSSPEAAPRDVPFEANVVPRRAPSRPGAGPRRANSPGEPRRVSAARGVEQRPSPSPPAASAEPRPAPPPPGGLTPRRVAVFAAAALVAAALAGVAGWGLASVSETTPAPPAGPQHAVLGDVTIDVPGDWTPGAPPKAIGAALPGARAFALTPGLPAQAVVAIGTADRRTLLPGRLERLLDLTPDLARPGALAGRAALVYHVPGTYSPGGVREISVLPTTAGTLLVACAAPAQVDSVADGCARAVRSVRVSGGGVLPASPLLAFRQRLDATVRTLRAQRDSGTSDLHGARTGRGQARAAGRLRDAHAQAAGRLRPLAADAGSRALVRSLIRVGRSYARLARAARRGDRAGYTAARRSALAADRSLRRAVAAQSAPLAPLGPRPGPDRT
jgi:hypothetical protein